MQTNSLIKQVCQDEINKQSKGILVQYLRILSGRRKLVITTWDEMKQKLREKYVPQSYQEKYLSQSYQINFYCSQSYVHSITENTYSKASKTYPQRSSLTSSYQKWLVPKPNVEIEVQVPTYHASTLTKQQPIVEPKQQEEKAQQRAKTQRVHIM